MLKYLKIIFSVFLICCLFFVSTCGSSNGSTSSVGGRRSSENSDSFSGNRNYDNSDGSKSNNENVGTQKYTSLSDLGLDDFDGENLIVDVNDDISFIENSDLTENTYVSFGDLDSLGRVTGAVVCTDEDMVGNNGMEYFGETTKTSLGNPTGYVLLTPIGFEDGLLSSCDLMPSWVTTEANTYENKITLTKSCESNCVDIFMDETEDYIIEGKNHVMFRTTPVFEDDELLARGILLEARSVETDDINLCQFVYNAEQGINIDYENLTAKRDYAHELAGEREETYSWEYRDDDGKKCYVFKKLTIDEIDKGIDNGDISTQLILDVMCDDDDIWLLYSKSDKENAKRLVRYKLGIEDEYTEFNFDEIGDIFGGLYETFEN